jgi:uncharacterized protein with HEPN domain
MQRDPAYLLDMLQAAPEAQRLSAGLTWGQFQQSTLHQYALVKVIEIIGEGARAISEEMKAGHPDIPWAPIIDMRNHLVHRYFRIDLPRVWDVLQNHLAPLVAQLEPLIPPDAPPPATP